MKKNIEIKSKIDDLDNYRKIAEFICDTDPEKIYQEDVYFNVDSANHLRQVLENPKKYAPTGIYIMRIHGTFVNFLDLSPAIQEDIIMRLEPGEIA